MLPLSKKTSFSCVKIFCSLSKLSTETNLLAETSIPKVLYGLREMFC